jgi:hypothetical protein
MVSNEDYLWDRSGPVDPEVERLERLLAPLALGPRAMPAELASTPGYRRRWSRLVPLAAAAAIALAVGLWWTLRQPAWRVEPVSGRPVVAARALVASQGLKLGEPLETDELSTARIQIGRLGFVIAEGGTRVRLVKSERREQRLALDRGTIVADISAPPRLFIVETKTALAIDLGCAYRLHVDERGSGRLTVTDGWVQLDGGAREAMVPAGASALLRAGSGPGTPVFDRAPAELRAGVARLDFEDEAPAERRKTFEEVLRAAEPRDALTLVTLLHRVSSDERGLVHDRLGALLPSPSGVTREGIVMGHREMLNRWWEAVPLPRTKKKFFIWPL